VVGDGSSRVAAEAVVIVVSAFTVSGEVVIVLL
jgi:hypothetical protein